MNSVMKIDNNGDEIWVIPNTENDKLSFCNFGILHKEDGPAINRNNGYKAWYINGKKHREDGPAVECSDGFEQWYINGKMHREDGPAIRYNNGDKAWYINGKMHREDGPAVEYNNGKIYWYLHDELITPTLRMMEKYIKLNPDNILKNYDYFLEIQLLAIELKPSVIFKIKNPHKILRKLYPKEMILRDSGLT